MNKLPLFCSFLLKSQQAPEYARHAAAAARPKLLSAGSLSSLRSTLPSPPRSRLSERCYFGAVGDEQQHRGTRRSSFIFASLGEGFSCKQNPIIRSTPDGVLCLRTFQIPHHGPDDQKTKIFKTKSIHTIHKSHKLTVGAAVPKN